MFYRFIKSFKIDNKGFLFNFYEFYATRIISFPKFISTLKLDSFNNSLISNACIIKYKLIKLHYIQWVYVLFFLLIFQNHNFHTIYLCSFLTSIHDYSLFIILKHRYKGIYSLSFYYSNYFSSIYLRLFYIVKIII